MRRWGSLLAVATATLGVLAAWTVRAAWPESDEGLADAHFLPISGDRLFNLVGGPGGRYRVVGDRVSCLRDEVGVDDELRCAGYRMFVRRVGASHRLVLSGIAAPVPSIVGSGRSADFVFPLPGLGAEALELLPIDQCPSEEIPELPVVCVRNGGATGGLIVDRSARQSQTSPLAVARLPVRHGESVLVDERDRLWVGHVPLRVRTEDGLVLLSVPEDEWTTAGGDRRWMAMELPSWPLAKDDAHDEARHVFWSREALFHTPPNPLAFHTNMAAMRVEYEQEEKLQAFIDEELLCLAASGRSLVWNLETGKGCDGSDIPAPPAALWREAELSAYQPGVRRILDGATESLAGLPERTPDPAGMVFVFDWGFEQDAIGALVRVPTRLLGVRPGSTRNGPPDPIEAIGGDDACAVARSGRGRPPIDALHGSTSAFLEVVEDGALARGTVLLLPGSRREVNGPLGSVCAWTGAKPPAGVGKLDPSASGKVRALPEAYSLGTLHVRKDAKGGVVAYGGPAPEADLPDGADGACATVFRGASGWTVVTDGDPNQVRIGETLAEGGNIPLVDGARVRIGPATDPVELVFHASTTPDHLAFDAVTVGHVERSYPFGSLASPVVGYGPLAGGIEGAGTNDLWDAAEKGWAKDACDKDAGEGGIELTLRGDLQRIVASELAAIGTACAAGDPRCSPKGDAVRASAVLLDANSGAVLAVGNWPAFDPRDAEVVEGLRRQLRLAGPSGSIQVPELENEAFLRSKNAGSAYKLGTSYVLARTGRLGPSTATPAAFACTRFTWYAPRAGVDEAGPPLLAPGFTPDGARSQPCGHSAVVLSDATAGYHDAFRKSINLYFGLAPFAVLETSGIAYAAPKHVSALKDPLENPLGRKPGLWSWDHEGRADLGLVLDRDFDVTRDLGVNNAFLDMLIATGHRFHYPKVGGGVVYTQRDAGVGDRTYPTAQNPWLPGLRVGGGFRYPSLVGPEAYAVEGVPGWSERDLVLRVMDGAASRSVAFKVGTSSIREYSRLGYGMGGVEASALSLAVLASPMARADGSVVAPDLIVAPAQATPGRLVTKGLLEGDGRPEIERAMRAVVNEPGSTAHGFFPEDVAARIGGKTGTFEIARMTSDLKFTDAKSWASIETVVRYACDVRGVEPKADDWKRFAGAVDKRSGRHRARLDQRPYVKQGLAELVATPPERGFGASAERCVDIGLRPGRPGVGRVVAGVDGGLWLDATMDLFPLDREDEELVEGSSFVAVMFDGLVDATVPGQPNPGAGWVLAVVVDGHGTGAKRAAARILDRLRDHLLVEQGLGMAP